MVANGEKAVLGDEHMDHAVAEAATDADGVDSAHEEKMENAPGKELMESVESLKEITANADQYRAEMQELAAQKEEHEIKKRADNWRDHVFLTLSEPMYSIPALGYGILIAATVVASVIITIVTSYRFLINDDVFRRRIEYADLAITVIFTFDYIARLILARGKLKFIIKPMNIIDLLSVLPFYIELGLNLSNPNGAGILRIFRVIRIFRLLHLARHSLVVQEFASAAAKAFPSICLLFVILIVLVLLFGTIMFYVETASCRLDEDTLRYVYISGPLKGEETIYQNVPISMWWAIVTVTTVGYGDTFPVTWAGQVVAVATMLSAIIVVAFPVTILGSAFSDSYDAIVARDKADVSRQPLSVRISAFLRRLVGKEEAAVNLDFDPAVQKLDELKQLKNMVSEEEKFLTKLREDPEEWYNAVVEFNKSVLEELKAAEEQLARFKFLKQRSKLLASIAVEQSEKFL